MEVEATVDSDLLVNEKEEVEEKMDRMKKVNRAPRGLAKAKARRDLLLKRGVLVGSERRRELRAKAVGALWSMMARKMIRSREVLVLVAVVVMAVVDEWE